MVSQQVCDESSLRLDNHARWNLRRVCNHVPAGHAAEVRISELLT